LLDKAGKDFDPVEKIKLTIEEELIDTHGNQVIAFSQCKIKKFYFTLDDAE
jgi:hypothetical protein